MSESTQRQVGPAIVVVTWECAEHLRALVASMNRELEGEEELIVIDNASSDDPETAARGWKGPLRFVALEDNIGFGAASNRGVAVVSRPVTILLNPDTEVTATGLSGLAAAAVELGGFVGPRVLDADGTVQPSASGPEVGIWPWLRALVPGSLQPTALRARTEPSRLKRRTRVSWLTGACIAGPTEVMRRLGPFDEELRMYGEDIDLGLRAAGAGTAVWFDPAAAQVVHHGQGSSVLAHGTREGWRAEGTINWRAALRRAYGPRRERLAWRALRLNLGLRFAAKRLLGRATERDRAALAAARSAIDVPELSSAADASGAGDSVRRR